MGAKLSFKYDRDADILHIDKRSPYPEQESEELGDEVIARLNPDTGEVENVEILFFSTRLPRKKLFELPISSELRISSGEEQNADRLKGSRARLDNSGGLKLAAEWSRLRRRKCFCQIEHLAQTLSMIARKSGSAVRLE